MSTALLFIVVIVCAAAIGAGAGHYRDTFHPLVYIGALLLALYGLLPLYLIANEGENVFAPYLSEPDLVLINTVNIFGVTAILLGVMFGAGMRRPYPNSKYYAFNGFELLRVRRAAAAVGLLGTAIFAYVRPGIGGWAESGYVRDAYLITLPSLIWLMVAYRGRRPGFSAWLLFLVVASPLALLGVLSGRRGPTFMILVGLAVGWYFMRRSRPKMVTVLGGGTALGCFLLLLVANRGSHYSTDFSFKESPTSLFRASKGNEYIYGGAQIFTYERTGAYGWGRRYLIEYIVKPIPRQLWETKYEDAEDFLGLPRLQSGPGYYFQGVLGWQGTLGSAPGIISDLWWEFSWLCVVPLFGLGWLYGMGWRRAVTYGGQWISLFGTLTSLSLYLIWQALDAFGFRFLVMALTNWIVWQYATGGAGKRKRPRGKVSNFPRSSGRGIYCVGNEKAAPDSGCSGSVGCHRASPSPQGRR